MDRNHVWDVINVLKNVRNAFEVSFPIVSDLLPVVFLRVLVLHRNEPVRSPPILIPTPFKLFYHTYLVTNCAETLRPAFDAWFWVGTKWVRNRSDIANNLVPKIMYQRLTMSVSVSATGFGKLLRVHLLFGNILSRLWQKIMLLGKFSLL